jgi:hypothetical protein
MYHESCAKNCISSYYERVVCKSYVHHKKLWWEFFLFSCSLFLCSIMCWSSLDNFFFIKIVDYLYSKVVWWISCVKSCMMNLCKRICTRSLPDKDNILQVMLKVKYKLY